VTNGAAGETKEQDEHKKAADLPQGVQQDSSEPSQIPNEHTTTLQTIFGEETTKGVINLYNAVLKNPNKKPRDYKSVISDVISDKEVRTQAHQAIRKIFSSKLDTKTDEENNTITISAAPKVVKERGGGQGGGRNGTPRVKNKSGWDDLGGEYLHFTLYKENKDTMEAVYFLASQMKMNVKSFQFGGTKDRRGVTTQRVSVYRVHAEQLARLNGRLRGSKIGDFKHQKEGLELGDLGGNEFVITLRDCHFPGEDGLAVHERLELAKKIVNDAVESFKAGGFINYYGLQRFGSFAASTDRIGMKLLQGNLKGAVDDILAYNAAVLPSEDNQTNDAPVIHGQNISSDDIDRAIAINIWQTTQNANNALYKLPRKFSAESNIIRHLGQKNNKSINDYQGALQTIPRNLRLMYVHAYQSLVWNTVAGERWSRWGNKVVEGDLVLDTDYAAKMNPTANSSASETKKDAAQEVDEAGEPIISASSSAATTGGHNNTIKDHDTIYATAQTLTADEASSGIFDITDIVLPLPGYDVTYPPNELGAFYKSFMASEQGGGLDPHDMRRSWKDMSLSGGYRKVVVRPGEGMSAEVRAYGRDDEQMVETDLEKLNKRTGYRRGPQQKLAQEAQDVEMREANTATANGATFGDPHSKIAVILNMKLGPSQYATMALREMMKVGGVKTYKPDSGGGR